MALMIGNIDYGPVAGLKLATAFLQAQKAQQDQNDAQAGADAQQQFENAIKAKQVNDQGAYQQGQLQNQLSGLMQTWKLSRIKDLQGQKAAIDAKIGTFAANDPAAKPWIDQSNSLGFQISSLGGDVDTSANQSVPAVSSPADQSATPQPTQAAQPVPGFTPKPIGGAPVSANLGLQSRVPLGLMTLQNTASVAPSSPQSVTTPVSPLIAAAQPANPPANTSGTQSMTLQGTAQTGPFSPYEMTPAEQSAAQLATRVAQADLENKNADTGLKGAEAKEHSANADKTNNDATLASFKAADPTEAIKFVSSFQNPDGSPNVDMQNMVIERMNANNPLLHLPKSAPDAPYRLDAETAARVKQAQAEAAAQQANAHKTNLEAKEVHPDAVATRTEQYAQANAAGVNASAHATEAAAASKNADTNATKEANAGPTKIEGMTAGQVEEKIKQLTQRNTILSTPDKKYAQPPGSAVFKVHPDWKANQPLSPRGVLPAAQQEYEANQTEIQRLQGIRQRFIDGDTGNSGSGTTSRGMTGLSVAAHSILGSTGGENGCATSVCKVFDKLGIPVPKTANAHLFETGLPSKGWVQTTAQDLDQHGGGIVTMKGRGPSGRHVAVYMPGGTTVEDPGKRSNYKITTGRVPGDDATVTYWKYVGGSQGSTPTTATASATSARPTGKTITGKSPGGVAYSFSL